MEFGARGSLGNRKDWRTLALGYGALNELSVQMLVIFFNTRLRMNKFTFLQS